MGFLRFLGFTLVRAGQGFWRNRMMSLAATATVILMLVLLSGLVIVLAGLNSGLATSRARWASQRGLWTISSRRPSTSW